MNNTGCRDFVWRIASEILRGLAYRSISIATVEERLCWPAGKLERFLIGAITEVDRDEFRLKDLASLAYVLEFDIEICIIPRRQETTG
jgi:hypothetical protein